MSAQNFVFVHVHVADKIVICTNLRIVHNYARTYALRIEMRNWNYNFGYFHEWGGADILYSVQAGSDLKVREVEIA